MQCHTAHAAIAGSPAASLLCQLKTASRTAESGLHLRGATCRCSSPMLNSLLHQSYCLRHHHARGCCKVESVAACVSLIPLYRGGFAVQCACVEASTCAAVDQQPGGRMNCRPAGPGPAQRAALSLSPGPHAARSPPVRFRRHAAAAASMLHDISDRSALVCHIKHDHRSTHDE